MNVDEISTKTTTNAASPQQDSPTSVVLSSKLQKDGEKEEEKDESHALTTTKQPQDFWQSLQANLYSCVDAVETNVSHSVEQVQVFTNQLSSQVRIANRQTITTTVLSIIATTVLLCMCMLLCFGAVILVTSPLWFPVALVTAPLWIPMLLFTSPLWLTILVGTVISCGCGSVIALVVFLFLAWPEEWLPASKTKQKGTLVHSNLQCRDSATRSLLRIQAKVLTYAAGVGPAADSVFLVLDRLDLEQFVTQLSAVDWTDLMHDVQSFNLPQLQGKLAQVVMAVVKYH